MSSLSGILSVAANSARVQQSAMQVVAQNVGNASTPGYSREQADLTALPGIMTPQGALGAGVAMANVTRLRDPMLDVAYRQYAADGSRASTSQNWLSQVEGIFGEPSDNGLAASMDTFWSAWSSLSNNPGNVAAQTAVRAAGAQVAALLNGYAGQLDRLQVNAGAQLAQSVQSFNQLARQVADLNDRIVAAESGGQQAPTLRDQRDQLVDQMSELAAVRAFMTSDGSVNVVIGGTAVVSGAAYTPLEVARVGAVPVVTTAGDPSPLAQVGGAIGALTGFMSDDLSTVRASLDALARGLVNAVNTIHSTGTTGVDFFDPTGSTASTMKLSAAVGADAKMVASGVTSTGDNSVALRIAALRDAVGAGKLEDAMGAAAFASQVGLPPHTSFGDSYGDLVSLVGSRVRSAANDTTAYQALTRNADTQRQSVAGVSLDEELTRLMQIQQAYAAAAKVVSAADTMAQTILDMLR